MDLNLKDRVVIVTGGAKGIGAGISLGLAKEGAIPIILSRSKASNEFENSLKSLTSKFEFIQIDLNNTDEIKPVIDYAAKEYGGIYAVVNNAGANDNKDLESTSWMEFDHDILRAVFQTFKIGCFAGFHDNDVAFAVFNAVHLHAPVDNDRNLGSDFVIMPPFIIALAIFFDGDFDIIGFKQGRFKISDKPAFNHVRKFGGFHYSAPPLRCDR